MKSHIALACILLCLTKITNALPHYSYSPIVSPTPDEIDYYTTELDFETETESAPPFVPEHPTSVVDVSPSVDLYSCTSSYPCVAPTPSPSAPVVVPIPVPVVTVISGTTVTQSVVGGTPVVVPIVGPVLTTAEVFSGTTVVVPYSTTVISGTVVVVPGTVGVVNGKSVTVPLTPYGVISGTVVPVVITPTFAPIVPIPPVAVGGAGGAGGAGGSGSGGSGGGGSSSAASSGGEVNMALAIGIPILIAILLAICLFLCCCRGVGGKKPNKAYAPAPTSSDANSIPSDSSAGPTSGGPYTAVPTSQANVPVVANASGLPHSESDVNSGPEFSMSDASAPSHQINMPLEGSGTFAPIAGAALAGAALYGAEKKRESTASSMSSPRSFQYATTQNPGASNSDLGHIGSPDTEFSSGGPVSTLSGTSGGPSDMQFSSTSENIDFEGGEKPSGPNKYALGAAALGAAAIAGTALAQKKEKVKHEEVITETTVTEVQNVGKEKKKLGVAHSQVEEYAEDVESLEGSPILAKESPKPERKSGLFEWVGSSVAAVGAAIVGTSQKKEETETTETTKLNTKKVVKEETIEEESYEEVEETVTVNGVTTTKIVRRPKVISDSDEYEEVIEGGKLIRRKIIRTGGAIAGGVLAGGVIASSIKQNKRKAGPKITTEGMTIYEEEWEAIEEEESSGGSKVASRIVREEDSKTLYPVTSTTDTFQDESSAIEAAKLSKKSYTRVVTRSGKIIYILVPLGAASVIRKRGSKTEIDGVTIYDEEWEALEAAKASGGRRTVTRIVHQTTGKVMHVLLDTSDVYDDEQRASTAAKLSGKIVTKIESGGRVKYILLPSAAADIAGIIIKTTRTIRIVKNNEKGEQIGTEEITIYEDESLAQATASKFVGRTVVRFRSTENIKGSYVVLPNEDLFNSETDAITEARKQGKVVVKHIENGITRWVILHKPVADAVGVAFIRPPVQQKSAIRTLRIVKNNEKGEQIGVDEIVIYEDEATALAAIGSTGRKVTKFVDESGKVSYMLLSNDEIFDDEAAANVAARTQNKVIVRAEVGQGIFKYVLVHAPVASTIKIKYTTPTRGPSTRTIRIVRTNEKNEQIGVDEVVLFDDQSAAISSAGDKVVVKLTESSSQKSLYTAIPSSEIFDDETLAFTAGKLAGKDVIQTFDSNGRSVYALLHTPVISALGIAALKRDSVATGNSKYTSGTSIISALVGDRDIGSLSDNEVSSLTADRPNVISNNVNRKSGEHLRPSSDGKRGMVYKTGRTFEGVVPEDIDVPDLSVYVPPAPTSHVVITSYFPKLPDEMPLVVGDLIGIEREFSDGWARGQNITQKRRRGLFPLTAVTPIKLGPTQTVAKVGSGESAGTNAGRYWLGWSGSGQPRDSSIDSDASGGTIVSPSDVAGAAFTLAETKTTSGIIPERTESLVTSKGETPPKGAPIQMLEDQLPISIPQAN